MGKYNINTTFIRKNWAACHNLNLAD